MFTRGDRRWPVWMVSVCQVPAFRRSTCRCPVSRAPRGFPLLPHAGGHADACPRRGGGAAHTQGVASCGLVSLRVLPLPGKGFVAHRPSSRPHSRPICPVLTECPLAVPAAASPSAPAFVGLEGVGGGAQTWASPRGTACGRLPASVWAQPRSCRAPAMPAAGRRGDWTVFRIGGLMLVFAFPCSLFVYLNPPPPPNISSIGY